MDSLLTKATLACRWHLDVPLATNNPIIINRYGVADCATVAEV